MAEMTDKEKLSLAFNTLQTIFVRGIDTKSMYESLTLIEQVINNMSEEKEETES